MSGFIKIAQVAEILGVSEIDARALCRFNGVAFKDGEQTMIHDKPFGKPPKLYAEDEVRTVLENKIR